MSQNISIYFFIKLVQLGGYSPQTYNRETAHAMVATVWQQPIRILMSMVMLRPRALLPLMGGERKLTGVNLKAVWAEFSTLSWAVFVLTVTACHRQARPRLEFKTRPRFCPVN